MGRAARLRGEGFGREVGCESVTMVTTIALSRPAGPCSDQRCLDRDQFAKRLAAAPALKVPLREQKIRSFLGFRRKPMCLALAC